MEKLFNRGLVVSCQATPEEPLYSSEIMGRLAYAAKEGGAVAVRVNTYPDLVAVRKAVDIPILGLIKKQYEGYYPYITPTMEEVDLVYKSGAEVVCIDATKFDRPDGNTLDQFVKSIRCKYPELYILGDVGTVEEGIEADKLGFDYIATTLSGYTPNTMDQNSDKIVELREPDYDIIELLSDVIKTPIIAEGRFWDGENAIKALNKGAYAVTIGAGITRPQIITKKIVDQINEVLD